MKHALPLKRIWLLPTLVAALVAAHAGTLYGMFSHTTWTLSLGALALILLLHSGGLSAVYTIFKRLLRHKL